MTNEELKNVWALQGEPQKAVIISPETIWSLAKASERFERTIFWRDVREWLATAVIVVFLLFIAFHHPAVHWLPIVAALIACMPMTYVAFLRWKRPEPKAAPSLRDHLSESIAGLRHQIGLLRSVFWWYLGPLALSLIVIFIDDAKSGRVHLGTRFFFSTAIAVAIFFGVWKLNQRAVRTDLVPRLHELEKTLADLEI